MNVGFEWHGHDFDADVVWNGEDYEVEAVHMIVGDNRVDMVDFMCHFNQVHECLVNLALKANDDCVANSRWP